MTRREAGLLLRHRLSFRDPRRAELRAPTSAASRLPRGGGGGEGPYPPPDSPRHPEPPGWMRARPSPGDPPVRASTPPRDTDVKRAPPIREPPATSLHLHPGRGA